MWAELRTGFRESPHQPLVRRRLLRVLVSPGVLNGVEDMKGGRTRVPFGCRLGS